MDETKADNSESFASLGKDRRYGLIYSALDLSYDQTRANKIYRMLDTPHDTPALTRAVDVGCNKVLLEKNMLAEKKPRTKEQIQRALEHTSALLLRAMTPDKEEEKIKGFVKEGSKKIFDLADAILKLSQDKTFGEFDFVAETRDQELEEVLLSSVEEAVKQNLEVFLELPRGVQEALVDSLIHSPMTAQKLVDKMTPVEEEEQKVQNSTPVRVVVKNPVKVVELA